MISTLKYEDSHKQIDVDALLFIIDLQFEDDLELGMRGFLKLKGFSERIQTSCLALLLRTYYCEDI